MHCRPFQDLHTPVPPILTEPNEQTNQLFIARDLNTMNGQCPFSEPAECFPAVSSLGTGFHIINVTREKAHLSHLEEDGFPRTLSVS